MVSNLRELCSGFCSNPPQSHDALGIVLLLDELLLWAPESYFTLFLLTGSRTDALDNKDYYGGVYRNRKLFEGVEERMDDEEKFVGGEWFIAS